VFDKLIQVLRFGCSYQGIADSTCSATTIRDRRDRRDEWNRLGIFSRLKQIVLETYDRIVGLILTDIAVDGCITKAPGGGDCAGRSPVDRGKQGMKRSSMVDGYGIPLGRVLAGANRHDSPLLAPTLDKLDDLGPLPDDITVHLDAGYDSAKTRDELSGRDLTGEIAHKCDKAPIQAGQRRQVERANAWHNAFNRLQRCDDVLGIRLSAGDLPSCQVGGRSQPSMVRTPARSPRLPLLLMFGVGGVTHPGSPT
jgi:hypothetical protein